MRLHWLLAVPAIGIAAPASAKLGMFCRPARGSGPSVNLVIGTVPGSGIVGAHLRDGDRILSTSEGRGGKHGRMRITDGRIDGKQVRLDLISADGARREAELRVRFVTPGVLPARGTLTRGGHVYRVRCIED